MSRSMTPKEAGIKKFKECEYYNRDVDEDDKLELLHYVGEAIDEALKVAKKIRGVEK